MMSSFKKQQHNGQVSINGLKKVFDIADQNANANFRSHNKVFF